MVWDRPGASHRAPGSHAIGPAAQGLADDTARAFGSPASCHAGLADYGNHDHFLPGDRQEKDQDDHGPLWPQFYWGMIVMTTTGRGLP